MSDRRDQRRRRIVALYTIDKLSLRDIAGKIGISRESIRYALRKAGVKIREAHRPRRLSISEREARAAQAEYSKFAGAWTSPADPSLKAKIPMDEQLKIYAGRQYDNHPSPAAGLRVSINPRQIQSYAGSYVGCAASMCAERGEKTLGWMSL